MLDGWVVGIGAYPCGVGTWVGESDLGWRLAYVVDSQGASDIAVKVMPTTTCPTELCVS
jgi:hypothetical protein